MLVKLNFEPTNKYVYAYILYPVTLENNRKVNYIYKLINNNNVYHIKQRYYFEDNEIIDDNPLIKKKFETDSDCINVIIRVQKNCTQKYFPVKDFEEQENIKEKIYATIKNYFKLNPKLYDIFGNKLKISIAMAAPGWLSISNMEIVKLSDKKNNLYILTINCLDDSEIELNNYKVESLELESDFAYPVKPELLLFEDYEINFKE